MSWALLECTILLKSICAGKQCPVLHEITQDTLAGLTSGTTFLGARALSGDDVFEAEATKDCNEEAMLDACLSKSQMSVYQPA